MLQEQNFLATASQTGNYSVSQLKTASQIWNPYPDTPYIDK